MMDKIFLALGVSTKNKKPIKFKNWECYKLIQNFDSKDTIIVLIMSGPKNDKEIKQFMKSYHTSVIIFAEKNKLFVKTLNKECNIPIDSEIESTRISNILQSNNVGSAKHPIIFTKYLGDSIDGISSSVGEFDNRGLFSTHYLKNRIFNDAGNVDVSILRELLDDLKKLLHVLGWGNKCKKACVVTTKQDNFSIREEGVVPSYEAISKLTKYEWVILTNGKKWRLYTSKVSASSTNYFEINLIEPSDLVLTYLGIIFGYDSYKGDKPKINLFFEQGKEYATQLEEKLSLKIMNQNGILINLVKGVLNHNLKTKYDSSELVESKETALRIIYRIWFLAYAESRNLLPIHDDKYDSISLRNLRNSLDNYNEDNKYECWNYLLNLFKGIRFGSSDNNLPQYNGELFKHSTKIDDIKIENKRLIPILRDLFFRGEDSIDYASLSVRHLGNILENVMEYSAQQAKEDIMFLEKNGKIVEVKTKQESNYSYKKNDLYLASKGGVAVRKSTASYYTPDEFVVFLVERGLRPILEEREGKIEKDLLKYSKNPTEKNCEICMDRLLDIQILDPTMGSGHFLVEALNKLTLWATEMLDKYPEHPLHKELEKDRETIQKEQKKKDIDIDVNLLTHDVLLKRRIMKKCIFGVDLNPMAVEITKLALWLDSFAIGVPLTFMDHHIKTGDSTIGMFLKDIADKKNQSLDDFTPDEESTKLLEDVSSSSDITIEQVHQSEDKYQEYVESIAPTQRILDALTASKIDDSILPKKSSIEFIHRFGRYDKKEEKSFKEARKKVKELAKQYKFFHWEIEMRDAFTDNRNGFDVILGNPPWDKIKPSDDEFFTPYNPEFRLLSPNTKKNEIMKDILKDKNIKFEYNNYLKRFKEKSKFFTTYKKQGSGDKELSKLIFERSLELLANDGMLSMVMPSQILASAGSVNIRKEILDKDISQLYVFENRKKIFNIDSRYRFMLLTLKNSTGSDKFPAGFYLHYLSSLQDKSKEKEKFTTHSKKQIREMFPDSLIIPETIGDYNSILSKMYKQPKPTDCLGDEFSISFSSGFHRTNDSDLFRDDGKGWPVHEGKTIHQFTDSWSKPTFTAQSRESLERENRPKYDGNHKEFYNTYRLVIRSISSPTNTRTIIAALIPPKTFHTHALNSIILKHNDCFLLNDKYLNDILYLCGIFNSISFDFIARQLAQVNMPAIMSKIPIPISTKNNKIPKLAAKLLVGHPNFEELAEKMRIPNKLLSISDRIDTAAKIDVLVAKSYGLTKEEYCSILKTFPLFKKNPKLREMDSIVWNNQNLKEFYGEMAKKAKEMFDASNGVRTVTECVE